MGIPIATYSSMNDKASVVTDTYYALINVSRFLCFALVTCTSSISAQIDFEIDLPEGFEKEASTGDPYTPLVATFYVGDLASGMIEVRYSDDWSFSTAPNEEWIKELKKNTTMLQGLLETMFDNPKIITEYELQLLGSKTTGWCVIYSGTDAATGIKLTNMAVSFVQNETLINLVGSSLSSDFHSNQKQFLKIFDSFKLKD